MHDDPHRYPKRRHVLGTIGLAVTGSVAGCLGDDTDGNGEGEADRTTDDRAEVPADAHCPVCNMVPAEYPDWNAQLVHENGDRAYFDTSGCMIAYYVAPSEFDAPDSPIANVWVTEFETGDSIDGSEAYYALETDPDRVDDPMMVNPAPFAERPDAVAYVEAVDYLSEDDIVQLAEIDRDTATFYRERFFEDDADETGDDES